MKIHRTAAKTIGTTAKRRGPGRPFQKGPDPHRNIHGPKKKKTIELSALLKNYLTDEGMKESVGEIDKKKVRMTNAEWLAKVIWRQAIKGEFQFVQYICDRIMGKPEQPLSGSLNFNGKLSITAMNKSLKGTSDGS